MASGPTWNRQRGFWYVQYFDGKRWRRVKVADGPPRWKPGDPDPAKVPPEAKAAFVDYQERETEARSRVERGVPALLRPFLEAHVKRYQKIGTRRNVRIVVDEFLAWCDREGITQFDQIDRPTCNRWLLHIGTTPPAPGVLPPSKSTIATKRSFLAAAWGRLLREEVITKNPWRGSQIIGDDRVKPRNAWTPDQFKILLDAADDWLKDILIFGVYTGLRIGAIAKIEWSDWARPQPGDDHFGMLNVRKEITKTKPYQVPVNQQLYELLIRREADPKRHPRYIMTGKSGRPLKTTNQTGLAIIATCQKAGLPHPHSPNHHMRRSFGRWAVLGHLTRERIPVYTVSKWLGHENVATTMIYLDLTSEESIRFMVPGGRRGRKEGETISPENDDSSTPPPASGEPA